MYHRLKRGSDNSNLNASYLPNFGGNYSNGANAGVFYLNVTNSATNANANLGGLPIGNSPTLHITLSTLALAKIFGELQQNRVSSFVEHSDVLERKINL